MMFAQSIQATSGIERKKSALRSAGVIEALDVPLVIVTGA